MFNFDTLIGQDAEYAKKILAENGYKNIKIIINSIGLENCNRKLVCAVRENENNIVLICGEFLSKLEDE